VVIAASRRSLDGLIQGDARPPGTRDQVDPARTHADPHRRLRDELGNRGRLEQHEHVTGVPLRRQTGLPREAIIERFIETFTNLYGAVPGTISAEEYAEAEALVESKFATDAWLRRVP